MADLSFLKFDPSKDQRKPFSMADYEAIPPEMRNEYVKTTSIPAKNQVSEKMDIIGEVPVKPVIPVKEKLKEIFAPQSVQPEVKQSAYTPPTQEAPAPKVSDSAGAQDITRQAQEMGSSSSYDWLPALAPLITEALMGGGGRSAGESLGISGDFLVNQEQNKLKRKQSLEDKLLEIQKARAIAGAKSAAKGNNFQSVNIVDPETDTVVKANYNKNTGEYTTPDGVLLNSEKIQAGYSVIPTEFTSRLGQREESSKRLKDYTPRKDEQTGLTSRIVDGEMRPIGSQRNLMNPKQEKDLDQQIAKFLTTDLYKKNSASLQSSATIEGLIRDAMSGNPTAANVARSEIAKIAEGGSRLTDQDVERVGGPQDFRSKVARFKNLQKTGAPLLESDLEGLRQVAKTISDAARMRIDEAMADMETANIQKGGVKGTIGVGMAPYLPKAESQKFPITVRKGNQSATISNAKELKEAKAEGWQ
jgi:hypothetical protein